LISKSQIKLITSLHQKKYRVKTGLFIAEGPKIIEDLLVSDLSLDALYATKEAMDTALTWQSKLGQAHIPVEVTPSELKKISALTTANNMLGVFQQPKHPMLAKEGLVVALDQVRDPGNLGTIIRLCDWFGVTQLVCSHDTVDCFNPKVVQATMGSIARVPIVYTDLIGFMKSSDLTTYAALMDGDNVYRSKLIQNAILVMGNEANGISSEVKACIQHQITIPNFGTGPSAESLNVATATGILLSEFRRATER